MSKTPWHTLLESMESYVFKILTPHGHGTGFQIFSNEKNICGVATAYHVIDHAEQWQEPIKLTHYTSKETVLIRENEREIFKYPDQDLAFILFHKGKLPLSKNEPSMLDSGRFLKKGGELSWCGFPSIAPDELCFFSGHVSSFLTDKKSYLIDGVAINGVSGGPAFDENGMLIGVVSAYIPNLAAGETLPGLCLVRSVGPYEEDLKRIKSLDEAAKQNEEKNAEPAKALPPSSAQGSSPKPALAGSVARAMSKIR